MNVNASWLPGALRLLNVLIKDETMSSGKYISKPSAIQNVRLAGSNPLADQRFSIETGGTQINCDEMHSFDSDFGTGAHFVALRRRMIDLPKCRSWKLPLQFGTKRIEACAEYDDLRNPVSKCGACQFADTFLS